MNLDASLCPVALPNDYWRQACTAVRSLEIVGDGVLARDLGPARRLLEPLRA